jgi:hypothetical protein
LVTFVLAIFAAILLPRSNWASGFVADIVVAVLLLSTLFLIVGRSEPGTSHAHPFDPPYDKRWFVPILVCLFLIIFAGFTLAALTGTTQVGQVAPPIHIFGLILTLSGFAMLTVFIVVSIMVRDMDPVSNVMILLVVIGPAIVVPIIALILMLMVARH